MDNTTFHPLLATAGAEVHLIHCELDERGQLLAGVVIAEAGQEDDHITVQAIADPSHRVYEVRLPPQLLRMGHRYVAYDLELSCRPA